LSHYAVFVLRHSRDYFFVSISTAIIRTWILLLTGQVHCLHWNSVVWRQRGHGITLWVIC